LCLYGHGASMPVAVFFLYAAMGLYKSCGRIV